MSVARDHQHAAHALHDLIADGIPASENFAWSPYSVMSGLGLLAEGAVGLTKEELVAAMAISPFAELEGQAALLRQSAILENRSFGKNSQIAVSNSLWTHRTVNVSHTYDKKLRSWPGSSVHVVDFVTNPQKVRVAINRHVEKTTRGSIRELLGECDITDETLAVLVSALWMKLVWTDPFERELTLPRPFEGPGGAVDAISMASYSTRPYAAATGWRRVSLAANGGVHCDILLPDDPDDLASGPTGLQLLELQAATRRQMVDLWLPKFDITYRQELTETLKRLGVRKVYDDFKSDLSGIGDRPLTIDKVIHEAAVKIDEEGAEAAAATAFVTEVGRAPSFDGEEKVVVFHVDRPFLLYLRNAETGVIYFIARIAHPRSAPINRAGCG